MDYSNPKIPEGINTSDEHPLKELSLLLSGLLLLLAAGLFLLTLLADSIAPHVPFSIEQSVFNRYSDSRISEQDEASPESAKITSYLQQLADRIALTQDLPEEMAITIHYLGDDTVNAFATLGGNILIHRGLLEKMSDENMLAMVMAHEIAHIKHRDPIKGLGRGVILGLVISSLSMTMGNQVLDHVLNSSTLLTTLHFNREQEQQADKVALHSLNATYGHTEGATDLFDILYEENRKNGLELPEFLSSHPENQARADRMREISDHQGWRREGKRTPLPPLIAQRGVTE